MLDRLIKYLHRLNILVKIKNLFHVLQQILDTCKSLSAGGDNLAGWQHEAVGAGITELGGEGVVRTNDVVHVVDGGTGGLVDSGADGSGLEGQTVDGLDGGGSTGGERVELRGFGGDGSAGVAISYIVKISVDSNGVLCKNVELTRHEELRVRMNIDEHLQALSTLDAVKLSGENLGLWSISSSETLEVIGARVGGSSSGYIPFVGPVAVDVMAKAGRARSGLTILTPETLIGLGI